MNARMLLIDNYDSFTFNLVQAFRALGGDVLVYQNDEISIDDAISLNPSHLCISPGPGTPDDAGISLAMIEAFSGSIPMLGVCLGHQCLVQHHGGNIVRAGRIMHGKTSLVRWQGSDLYDGMSQPFEAGRYHSLCAEIDSLPANLALTATTSRGEIMGVKHEALMQEGVQFHPESVRTPDGDRLMANFLRRRLK